MRIGYIRVSTQEQNTIRQEILMERLGVDELYIDRASGKNAQRPELQKMMEYVRRGDTVIVESISRFARNTRDLLELVERLTGKGVEFISQKEAIDTTNLFLYSWPKERFSADFRHTPALYLYNYGGEERSDRRPGPLLCQIEYNLWSGGAWKIFCRGSEQTSL